MIEDAFFKNIINKSRVGRLATVDLQCKPHLISAVFVFDNDCNCYFIPIDEKTKRSRPKNLRRANSNTALKLSTTSSHITTVPNSINSKVISEFLTICRELELLINIKFKLSTQIL